MSEKLSSGTICNLLDNLIGDTKPVGDIWKDHSRLINLKTLINVVNYCLDGVKRSAETEGIEYSVVENRETAKCALMEWRDWINEVLEE